MTAPMEDDGSHDAEYGMVMPFVVCQSQGGPYDDDAYVSGYEAGLLDCLLGPQRLTSHEMTAHSSNVPQLDLIAMRYGYEMTSEETVVEGWTSVRFVRRP